MTRQIINVGTADKGNGDPIRVAFSKANDNFAELYNILSNNTGGSIITTDVIGSVFADDSTLLVDGINGRIPYSVLSGAPTIPSIGNVGFRNDTVFDLAGLAINNSNTVTDSTAGINIPANGSGVVSIVNNAKTWSFERTGNTIFPTGLTFRKNGTPYSTITTDLDKVLQIETQTSGGEKQWSFGTDGWLTVPANGVVQADTIIALSSFNDTNNIARVICQSISNAPQINLRTITSTGAQKDWIFKTDGSLQIPGDIRSEGNIDIEINLSDSTLRRWQFGEDGDLTIPGAVKQGSTRIAFDETGGGGGPATVIIGAGANELLFDADGYLTVPGPISTTIGERLELFSAMANGDSAQVYLDSENSEITLFTGPSMTPKTWKFDGDGSLTIPGNIRSEGNIDIDINLADSTLRRWQFGEDGELTLPEDAVVKTISGNLTVQGQSYVFIDSATNGQIEIGRSSGVGAVSLGNKSRGTNVVVDDLQVANGVYEFFSSLADATGVVTHNCANGHIFYHTSPDANWTVNLTNLLDTWNRATSVTIIIAQGATGYYPNAVQIAGVAQTINWQGNVTPTPSTNRTDVVRFSIINNSGTYTVLGQLTGF